MSSQIIQWYPGHIAKAEKQISKVLEKIDLVIEVRDARIPVSTSHPYIQKWIKNKKHLLVINRKDMISAKNIEAWHKWFKKTNQNPFWCNAKTGEGVSKIKKAAIEQSNDINQRRQLRGMKERPIRALLLGFPNVGKSALINRLIERKVVSSSRRAGVTRSLQWVRVGQKIDLLDAPGVLPPQLKNQEAAIRLAICDDIGQGAYDVELVAIAFLNILINMGAESTTSIKASMKKRYGISLDENEWNTHQWLASASKLHTSDDLTRMSQKLLDDFRRSLLGPLSLDLPI